jgi:DNA-binding transcriptional LysR family regulator
MDLNLLVTVDAVLTTRSATLASSRLHVTQSAVSNALKRARVVFADKLVVRRGSGFALTPKAEALAPRLRELLDGVRDLLADDVAPAAPPWFTIACVDSVAVALVPLLLPALQKRLPLTKLRVVTPDHLRMVGLDRSAIDLVIGALPDTPAGCESEDLLEDPMVVIADSHNRGAGARISLHSYARLPHAELAVFGEPEDRIDRALATHGLQRRIDVVVPYLTALPFLVHGSERIATVTRSVAQRYQEPLRLRCCPPPFPLPPIVVRMVWHRRRGDDAAHGMLRELVRAAAHGLAQRTPRKASPRRRR